MRSSGERRPPSACSLQAGRVASQLIRRSGLFGTGVAMMGKRFSAILLAVAGALALGAGPATAGGLCTSLVLSCEDGRDYPLCPIAVSDAGEIVTGNLVLASRRGVHVRLVPMGV